MAGTLVDFPEVMRCGGQEKNKGLVRYPRFIPYMTRHPSIDKKVEQDMNDIAK